MDISKFLTNLEGKWLAQQTLHNLALEESISNKAEVYYKQIKQINDIFTDFRQYLDNTEKISLINLCWNNKKNQLNYNLCFFQVSNQFRGQFIKWESDKQDKLSQGSFYWSKSGILNLYMQESGMTFQEKIYTPTDKLKLVNSIQKKYGIYVTVSFISEIKFTL
uniref:chromophore lyase cpcS/cpeS n=1 Tax=Goniotrichopsis reniformis TaxID=468933 RepID=UPI001FCD2705|nr:chromophore lyase cpcS/cpeS [Goniotrichopsis reniformis]UNJ14889.1 chromophore lyase cpcS/cpeS [Goniotrichopsis reniformis]